MDAPILHTPGIQCTPHTGAETVETYHNISMMAAQAVIDLSLIHISFLSLIYPFVLAHLKQRKAAKKGEQA